MKCLKCDKVYFLNGKGLSFWLNNVAYSGVTMFPNRGTKKKFNEKEVQVLGG